MKRVAIIAFVVFLYGFALAHDTTETEYRYGCSGTCSSSILHEQTYKYKYVKTIDGYFDWGCLCHKHRESLSMSKTRMATCCGGSAGTTITAFGNLRLVSSGCGDSEKVTLVAFSG